MLDNNILKILSTIEDIYYQNGSDGGDSINLGQIIISYSEKEYKKQSYHIFQNWLNDILTLNGATELLSDIEAHNLMDIYINIHEEDCIKNCPESVILIEFKSIVEFIQRELDILKTKKKHELSDLIDLVISKRLNPNVQEKLQIEKEMTSIRTFIKDEIIKEVNLDFKNVSQLSKIVSEESPFMNDYVATYTMEYIYLRSQSGVRQ